ncbi:helix-turn-helix domain-containing protein [Nocardioides zeae]|uniref:Helix-turn-helix domain-containing protein n=1 Tax=Nocardioides imazamoxiresistens TaxID=3231893 RepID=A0ABU3PW97_9ACTN|nr:helix-turn-helix domain-containing protein [Nocardioides zeae]MDT9593510.1 helix-turn-helix domain-containing protein [Nocardioides zeae]
MSDRPAAASYRPISDARTLRAFAHPVRSRILDELNARGPQRSADLAEVLGLPANQVSFHVRNLATYGLVVEAPEHARDRRDRVWKLADDGHGFTLELARIEDEPGGASIASAWRGLAVGRAHREVEAAYSAERDPATVRNIMQATFLLTKEEAEELAADLNEVMGRWTGRSRESGGEGRQVYALLQLLQPRPDDLAPGSEGEDA